MRIRAETTVRKSGPLEEVMKSAMSDIGKLLIGIGLVIALAGVVLLFAGKLGIGKLPGDFVVRRGNFTFYFPLATSILLSAIVSLAFWLLRR